jgi:hypothetical protein
VDTLLGSSRSAKVLMGWVGGAELPYRASGKGICFLEKISSVAEKKRIPAEASRIQVNFCKNPACGNYGLLPARVVQTF